MVSGWRGGEGVTAHVLLVFTSLIPRPLSQNGKGLVTFEQFLCCGESAKKHLR